MHTINVVKTGPGKENMTLTQQNVLPKLDPATVAPPGGVNLVADHWIISLHLLFLMKSPMCSTLTLLGIQVSGSEES